MRAALLAALCLVACTPFYRVDEAHGLRVADGEERVRLQARAHELMSLGRPGAAAEAYQHAVELDPDPPAELFLSLAQARAADGQRAPARAAARLGLTRNPLPPNTRRGLRELLVRQYAADGLIEPALDFLPEPSLEGAMRVSELAQVLGPLADADQLARAGRGTESLARYEEWLAAFGVPTHRLLVGWSGNVLRAAAGPAGQAALEADRAAEEGRFDEAVALYALVFRFQSPATFDASVRARFETACARAAEPGATDEVLALTAKASDALGANRLGEALGLYRRAVASAPWWPEARHNLALLLAQVEQYAEALRHMQAFLRLSRDPAMTARAQARVIEWERRADPAQAEQVRAEAQLREADLTRHRSRARAWRDRGFVLMSAGAVVGAGAVACAVVGLRTNDQVRAGNFDTGRDILLATEVGKTANTLGTILAVTSGALVAIGLPIVLFSLDPAAPQVSVVGGPGFAGFAVSGVLP
ncbi:MAG: tetratricopeptide repeat protein [Archangium sp.]|nr:tetratricopeptide repeat protein [Archangium sp.]